MQVKPRQNQSHVVFFLVKTMCVCVVVWKSLHICCYTSCMKHMLCLKCLLDCLEQFGLLFQVPEIPKHYRLPDQTRARTPRTHAKQISACWCREIWVGKLRVVTIWKRTHDNGDKSYFLALGQHFVAKTRVLAPGQHFEAR